MSGLHFVCCKDKILGVPSGKGPDGRILYEVHCGCQCHHREPMDIRPTVHEPFPCPSCIHPDDYYCACECHGNHYSDEMNTTPLAEFY